MAVFNYKAKDNAGAPVSGKIEAANLKEALAKLRGQGLRVLSTEQQKGGLAIEGLLGKINILDRPGLGDKVIFSRQLSTLINAGIPVVQCLNILVEQVKKKSFQKILTNVRRDIEGGEFISSALAKYPSCFDRLYVSMVKSGEVGGVLDEVLERIAAYLENIAELRRKVIGAMVYPAMILLVAIGVVTFLLVFVIPKFKEVFEVFGEKLPKPTQILINISEFLVHWIWLVFLIIFVIVVIFNIAINRSAKIRLQWHRIILKIPLFGDLFRKIAIARFTRTLGTLVRSGVPILEALDIVAQTSGNRVIELAILDARNAIKEGERISDPLKRSGVFPPMVVQMISVGEETGALDAMLFKAADYYDREVDATVAALSSILEPMMIVILGVVVGFIVICMYLPIFSLPGMIK
ncbi:MAG: type II secretion system inner membrane protein GspF [bacterium]